MKLRYAVITWAVLCLTVTWVCAKYNPEPPPAYAGNPVSWLWALGAWPTGNRWTLAAVMFAVSAWCLLAVRWRNAPRTPWWQVVFFIVPPVAAGLGCAAYLGFQWR